MTEIRITEEPSDGAEGAALLAAQARELVERYGDDGVPGRLAAEDLTTFLVARDARSGAALGCGALVAHSPETVEIVRMYVTPEARRRRLGREILSALEREAALRHFVAVRLETGDRQPESIALYEGAGYRPVPCWAEDDPRARCYERDITPSPAD